MRKAWGYVSIVFTLLICAACAGRGAVGEPTEEELRVFTQTMLIEAALQDFSGPTRDSLASVYYGQLYDAYGIDAAWLDGMRDRFDRDIHLWESATDSLERRFERHRGALLVLLDRVPGED